MKFLCSHCHPGICAANIRDLFVNKTKFQYHKTMQNQYYVYIVTNKPKGTLYTGVTSNLIKRIYEHKSGSVDSFTSKYKLNKLAYYEIYNDINEAIKKEKQIKKWRRDWKIELIESNNPGWDDLYGSIVG